MPGQAMGLDPELDAQLTAMLNSPYARMGHAAQLWNLDARRKGREEIPWEEFGLSGNTYDPNRVTERAWNAYNTIGSEQAANAVNWRGTHPTWTTEPFSNRFSPGAWAAGTLGAATTQTAPTPQPSAPPATPQVPPVTPALPNLAQLFGQAQAAPPATVHPMATGPMESQQSHMQQNALQALFNFPTLRVKKPAQSAGGMAGTPGQYNENFWNAWRI
jgi:hypothetical protein